MTSANHKLTAGAFGVLVSLMYLDGMIASPFEVEALYQVATFMAGMMIGASAPDWLEMVKHVGNRRISIIPHRTLTHWPVLWLVAGYLVSQSMMPWYAQLFAYAFIVSSLLHLAMDSFSKSGIPILLPMASFRMRIPLYSTGKFSESIMAVAVLALFLATFKVVEYL